MWGSLLWWMMRQVCFDFSRDLTFIFLPKYSPFSGTWILCSWCFSVLRSIPLIQRSNTNNHAWFPSNIFILIHSCLKDLFVQLKLIIWIFRIYLKEYQLYGAVAVMYYKIYLRLDICSRWNFYKCYSMQVFIYK